jgi:hypothetical protein
VQVVAETTAILDRPAQLCREKHGKRHRECLPGPPLALTLIVRRVTDVSRQTVAVWYLLTNAPAELDKTTLALFYCCRRVDSFVKLLKGARQQVDNWQQESGATIAKRLSVAAMVCALVWRIDRHPTPGAAAFRQLLVQWSGRQMEHQKCHTIPALRAGLWVLLTMLETLTRHSVEDASRPSQIRGLHLTKRYRLSRVFVMRPMG